MLKDFVKVAKPDDEEFAKRLEDERAKLFAAQMKIKDAGLPQAVLDQTPKALRGSKMPIIKAKIGPQIMSLICEEKIFEDVPVKKEVKAAVSGIYVLEVKGLHGTKKETEVAPKKGFKAWVDKLQEKAGAKPIK